MKQPVDPKLERLQRRARLAAAAYAALAVRDDYTEPCRPRRMVDMQEMTEAWEALPVEVRDAAARIVRQIHDIFAAAWEHRAGSTRQPPTLQLAAPGSQLTQPEVIAMLRAVPEIERERVIVGWQWLMELHAKRLDPEALDAALTVAAPQWPEAGR